MQKLKINPAHDKKKLEGFIFFAERIRELLADHTMDSFKASALNTKTRALELQRLFLHAFDTTQRANSLSALVEEFSESLKNDPIIARLKTKDVLDRLMQIVSSGLNNEKPKLAAEAADALISANSILSNYYDVAKQILLDEIPKNKEKKIISTVADTLVIELQAKGFSREYIRHVSKTKLAGRLVGTQPFEILDALTDFLDAFDGGTKDYSCVMKCSGKIDDIASRALKLSVVDEVRAFQKIELLNLHGSNGPVFERYLIANEVKGKDPFSARNILYETLYQQNAIDLFALHKASLSFDSVCLVKDATTKKEIRVREPKNIMLIGNTNASTTESFEKKQNALMRTFAHFDAKSKSALISVIRYHKEAIDSFSSENKLVDLWAALEGFVPQPIDQSPRVSSVIDHILPILSLIYANQKFCYLASWLSIAGEEINSIISSLSVEGPFSRKVASLILCPELEKERNAILDLLDFSPLLRYRLYLLHEAFASPKKAHDEIMRHRKRLDYQLRRIYISRNTVMHSATVHSDIDHLVENLHSYLDATVNAVVKTGQGARAQININALLKVLSAHEEAYLHMLDTRADKDKNFTLNNFGDAFDEGRNPLLTWT